MHPEVKTFQKAILVLLICSAFYSKSSAQCCSGGAPISSNLALPSFLWLNFGTLPIEDGSRWVADPSSKDLKNPWKGENGCAKKGRAIFKLRCVVCHGEDGQGNGPGSKLLNPKPANLSSDLVQSQVDGEIFWKISEGRGAMITWKNILPEQDRWHLAA